MADQPVPPPPLEPPKPVETATPSSTTKESRLRARWNRISSSRVGSGVKFAYHWRRPLLFGLGASFFVSRYYYARYQKGKRDRIEPGTYLVWRLYDGAIVEYPSNQTNLSMLLGSSGDGTEPPRVMTLYDAIRTIKFAEGDDRIVGLIADMSSTNAPSVNQDLPLGLAQIEELQNAILELKISKDQSLGPGKFRTVAFTETFRSQGEYTMASGFDEIYCQPTGEIPLVGINSTVTFYSKLLNWLGIKVHAEARTKYKSMVAPYTQEEFSEPQADNHMELLDSLNTNMLSMIAINRFGSEIIEEEGAEEAEFNKLVDRVKGFAKRGPLMAQEAVELGLLTGTLYKEELLSKIILGDNPLVLDEDNHEILGKEKYTILKEALKSQTKGFHHYHKIMDQRSERNNEEGILNVGVVYVLGTIGDMGEFGTSAIVKGLHEAAEDDTIGAVVLRIDSGGGGVVESDTIWGAVKDLKAKGKVVIASFGNAAASGGYLIATHADIIFASQSTITGSIGVASLRPTITSSFLDRIKLTTQSFFTGSNAMSLYHELEGEQMTRHKAHIDAAYQDFKDRVCEGRNISPELIEVLAGGRVYTGKSMWELNEKLNGIPTKIEGPEAPQKSTVEVTSPKKEAVLASSEETLTVDQPDLTTASAELFTTTSTKPSSKKKIDEEVKALVELANKKKIDEQVQTPPVEPEKPNNEITIQGPLGRGIIDGIGGIREAAIEGAETYLNRLIEQTREEFPDKTQEEIMEDVLPGVPYVHHDDGAATLNFDIRLKKFPVHKTFWQQLSEASKREGSDNPVGSTFKFVRESFSNWLTSSIVNQIEADLVNSLHIKPHQLNELKGLVKLVNSHDQRRNGSSFDASIHPSRIQ
ncbi:hypothetical protein MJO28_013360 [Puccinia striiformis f. sp. tritici]|uniref:Uncharacterized protein n=1 Tax=Puccinia striiformis f. sp. tritici TaxID=168172 RepID=A0ACC0DZ79_9BASI|nr:hypothetical protein Pst134EB_024871 [Puccinia striiformis f. sp. tritici]KAI7941075.1 hypothetical protein MJO28_013360 [Puccinia striiformis f. sp. tritici]KAI7942888.1 hypothetical protein MJO29_012732 [Puccinia striiformis f. sp. tritici]KAI9614462.1 hypothetical protein KEM48_006037 [Puccinia striiformis f. sp. tritici PST-130]